ncbi:hypothetical protein [Nitrosomonas sp. Is37]|uniref:hypothetical protein n=1 Tax=Nitrosomonas sp. Is37 TaxID=3080535 RepID=UPI00294AB16F|nr:hypothetical protein [Nitrosomonas sp. Is37]MDV6343036.1 hypothetical protein [Nitrosomonas sp. Is37]
MNHFIKHTGGLVLAIAGAFSFGVIALQQGESINAIWIVIATICEEVSVIA